MYLTLDQREDIQNRIVCCARLARYLKKKGITDENTLFRLCTQRAGSYNENLFKIHNNKEYQALLSYCMILVSYTEEEKIETIDSFDYYLYEASYHGTKIDSATAFAAS